MFSFGQIAHPPRCVSAVPLNEVGVMYSYGETLLPDVDGLQHPSMPQLT